MTPIAQTTLLGAELELVADRDLSPILAYLDSAVGVVRNSTDDSKHTLWLELAPSEVDLDDAVHRYASIVDALPQTLRMLWNACTDRCINVGVQAGPQPHAFAVALSEASAARLSTIATRLVVTVYACDQHAGAA